MAEPGAGDRRAGRWDASSASPEMKKTGAGGGGGVGGGGVGGGGGAGGRVPPNIGGFPGKDAGSDAAVFPPLTDFPADPIIDSTAPANAPALFDGSTPRADGAPCITSPIAGTLMPRNWLRPVFALAPAAGENLFEIDPERAGIRAPASHLHAQPEHGADRRSLEQPATSINDTTITVTMRALQTDAAGAVQVAPSARSESTSWSRRSTRPGKIVYWALPTTWGRRSARSRGSASARKASATCWSRARSPRARRPRRASAATPPRPTATASASRWGRPTTSGTSPTSAPAARARCPATSIRARCR